MASTNQQKSDSKASPTADAGEAELQAMMDEEQAKGYRGVVADPTPNSAYTVGGVTAGEPTPETDAEAAKAAEARRVEVSAPKFPEGSK